ncbi:lipase [Colwellia sp. D2M02]|uniref:VolA/Pla-1 family phospholipase n=1 Tax=Colwellia sp. D2M02 TaxID=2841562 RepID=UPI001C086FCA|nr:VolA/Pla-1 family phospholipase [Colwellia sp. D2M02]MBU2891909.1 lipase [Colwellia sp. D2M02]
MKKLALSISIISALGLSACNNETIEDVKQEVIDNGSAVTPLARIVFDPGADEPRLSVPNDLMFSGSVDGTLNIPVADSSDFSDPSVSINGLDGWSNTHPFKLAIDYPEGVSLNAESVYNPEAVHIYETLMGGDASDADCQSLTRGLACKVVNKLTFGVDYITQLSDGQIAIVPLKPLSGKTSYVIALTNHIKDNNGNSLAPAISYELVRQDITTAPLATESQLLLQGLTNSYENAVVAAGADKDSLIYTFALTTQSTNDVLFTAKALLAAPLAQGGLPPVIAVADTGISVAQAFEYSGIQLPDNLKALYSTGNLYKGSVTLPYYLGVPSIANPTAPVNSRWKSLCDSGAMLAGLAASNPEAIPEGPLSESDATCMAVSQNAGLPAPGLRDLSSVMPVDVERHLTKYSPVPAPSPVSDIPWIPDPSVLEVQMTTPDISPTTDAVRASFGLPALTGKPESGWPVIILQHGITSKKEDMLVLTGILSAFGFATVAIDHPLHGSRGFDLDNVTDENGMKHDEISASTVSATHYMNLASLLTNRDNLRQSTIDMLGLRLGLNAVVGADIDASKVQVVGHSLGAIASVNFTALANTPLNPALDGLFKVSSASLAMPGAMIANFLMESGDFSPLIKGNLTYKASPAFKAMVDAAYPEGATEAELRATFKAFYSALTPEQQAGLDATFAQFGFAAQTVVDSADPVNYAGIMAMTNTATHLIEVVGNGVDVGNPTCTDIALTDNCADQVIPNRVSVSPLGGTEGVIALLGLPSVSSTTQGSGAVRFVYGHHSSILTPAAVPAAPDAVKTAQATQEMQTQVAAFFATMGQAITITNTELVK